MSKGDLQFPEMYFIVIIFAEFKVGRYKMTTAQLLAKQLASLGR